MVECFDTPIRPFYGINSCTKALPTDSEAKFRDVTSFDLPLLGIEDFKTSLS